MDETHEQRRVVAVAIIIAAAVVLFVVFGVPHLGRADPYRAAGPGIMIAQGNAPAGPPGAGPSGVGGPPAYGGPGAAGGAAGAAPVVSADKGPPLEAWRLDPFSPIEPAALEAKYAGFAGPRWENLPMTLRTGYPRPRAPFG